VSRLRRPFLADRYFFITVHLLKERAKLADADFHWLALPFNRPLAQSEALRLAKRAAAVIKSLSVPTAFHADRRPDAASQKRDVPPERLYDVIFLADASHTAGRFVKNASFDMWQPMAVLWP
jgi:hypothetical protein